MAGKFECFRDKSGGYRFRLVAGNGETILASESYKAKASCAKGIESVRKNSADPNRFVKNKTSSGKFRFNLTATNGQVIGTSQNYSTEAGCDNGMKSVANNAPGASIDDQT